MPALLTTKPRSLVNPGPGSTSATRRAIADLLAVNGAPVQGDPTEGFSTAGQRFLHIEIELTDAATTVEWKLWLWSDVNEKWHVDTRAGVSGLVELAESDDDNPQKNIIEIAGSPRCYIEFVTMTGAFASGVNVWLSANSYREV
jgi:hypothetical protein